MKLKVLIIVLVSLANYGWAACDGTLQRPCVVKDPQKGDKGYRHFRTSFDILAAVPKAQQAGLKDLYISGSDSATTAGWAEIIQKIRSQMPDPTQEIIIVDLRQENHAQLNGESVELRVDLNWINRGKTHEDALAYEKMWLQNLLTQTEVEVLEESDYRLKNWTHSTKTPIQSVASEEQVVTSLGARYLRFPIPDHLPPPDLEVDRFVTFIKNLKPGTWVHFHCLAGHGRTTTFMAMDDMLHNADHLSLKDIVHRQAAVSPQLNILKVLYDPEPTPLEVGAAERALFAKEFYEYARAYREGYAGPWSTWRKEKGKEEI